MVFCIRPDTNYKDILKVFFGIDYGQIKEDIKEIQEYDLKVFKVKFEDFDSIRSYYRDKLSVSN